MRQRDNVWYFDFRKFYKDIINSEYGTKKDRFIYNNRIERPFIGNKIFLVKCEDHPFNLDSMDCMKKIGCDNLLNDIEKSFDSKIWFFQGIKFDTKLNQQILEYKLEDGEESSYIDYKTINKYFNIIPERIHGRSYKDLFTIFAENTTMIICPVRPGRI